MIEYLTGLSPIKSEVEGQSCNKCDYAAEEIQKWLITMTMSIKWVIT